MTIIASPIHIEADAKSVDMDFFKAEVLTTYDLSDVSTKHGGLLAWVAEVAVLTQFDWIYWMDGSDEEYKKLTDELIAAGTMVRLNEEKKPNSFWVRTDPSDVARVEQRTFICSVNETDA